MKQNSFYLPFLLALVFSITTNAQNGNRSFLTVEGEVLKPLKLNLGDLSRFKPAEVKAKDREGKEHLYKGIRLVDVLDSAGVTLGKNLRGENLAKYVLMKAVDGYEVIYSLAEVDPELSGQTIIIATEVDGNLLRKGEGPFRIVAANDKRPARWIRELVAIKVAFAKN